MKGLRLYRSLESDYYGPLLWKLRPYGQPGPLPIGGLPPLLIELKAQFYRLVTL